SPSNPHSFPLPSHPPPPPPTYPLSLHDALPISATHRPTTTTKQHQPNRTGRSRRMIEYAIGDGHTYYRALTLTDAINAAATNWRSEEHTSELQSRFDLVCRLLLEKKK